MKEVLLFFDGVTAIPSQATFGKKEIYKVQLSQFPQGQMLLYNKKRDVSMEYAYGEHSEVITEIMGNKNNQKAFVYARPVYSPRNPEDLIALKIVGEAPWQKW